MTEPQTRLTLEAPAGLVEVIADCRNGKAERITFCNVPAFTDRLGASLEVGGLRTLTVNTAFGGDSFVIADASALGFGLTPDEARDIAVMGRKIVAAANEQLHFKHPSLPGWNHFSFCFVTGPLERLDGCLSSRNACVINPGKLDRSPTGTGCSALMAVLHATGRMKTGETFIGRSIIESRFIGRIEAETIVGGKPAIIPSITGRAWITEEKTLRLDPDDPWPGGYKIADTWPLLK
jgi:proline racemase